MGKLVTIGKRRIRKIRQILPRGRRTTRYRSIVPRRMLMIRKGHIHLMKRRPSTPRTFKRFKNPFFMFYLSRKPLPKPIYRQATLNWARKSIGKAPFVPKTKHLKGYQSRAKINAHRVGAKKKGHGRKSLAEVNTKWQVDRLEEIQKARIAKARLPAGPKRKQYNPNMVRKHPWAGTNRYGPVGHLGPNLIVEFKPTQRFAEELRKIERIKTGGSYFRRMVESSIDDFRDKLIEFAEKFIYTYVPEETGRLRKSLLKNFKIGRRVRFSLRMRVSSSRDRILKYAKPVNEMPVSRLAHNPKNNYGNPRSGISRRTRRPMHDPKAQHHFFSWLYLSLRKKAKVLFKDMIKKITILLTKTGSPKQYQNVYRLPRRPRHRNKIQKKDPGITARELDIKQMEGYIQENINFPDITEGPGGLRGVKKKMEQELKKYKRSKEPQKLNRRTIRGWFTVKFK